KKKCTIRWHYHFGLGENLTCVKSRVYGNFLSKTLLLTVEEKLKVQILIFKFIGNTMIKFGQ
ncbi:MAG: hypothetical protein ACOY4H_03435, partial [Thermodesulfobacteriota bacterium]